MPARPASGDLDRRQRPQILFGNIHRIEIHLAGVERDAALNRVANGTRLLVYLLEHEMLEAALLRHDRVPRDPLLLRLDDVAVKIRDADRIFRQDRDLAVAEKENVARVLQDRRDVGRDKKFAVAQTDDDRRTFANGDDRIGLVDRNYRKCKNSLEFLHRFADGQLRATDFRVYVMSDQMSDDLSVGLGLEFMPFAASRSFSVR